MPRPLAAILHVSKFRKCCARDPEHLRGFRSRITVDGLFEYLRLARMLLACVCVGRSGQWTYHDRIRDQCLEWDAHVGSLLTVAGAACAGENRHCPWCVLIVLM